MGKERKSILIHLLHSFHVFGVTFIIQYRRLFIRLRSPRQRRNLIFLDHLPIFNPSFLFHLLNPFLFRNPFLLRLPQFFRLLPPQILQNLRLLSLFNLLLFLKTLCPLDEPIAVPPDENKKVHYHHQKTQTQYTRESAEDVLGILLKHSVISDLWERTEIRAHVYELHTTDH